MITGLCIYGTVLLGVVLTLYIAGRVVMRTAHPRTATIGVGIGHGVGLFGLYGHLYFIVPLFKKVFADFGVELPAIGILVIFFSDLVIRLWYFGFLAVLVAFAVDVCVFNLLHKEQSSRKTTRRIALAVSVVLVIANVAVFVGMLLPSIKLLNDLA